MLYTENELREIERIAQEIPLHHKVAITTRDGRECILCRFYLRKKKQCKLQHCYFFED